MAANTLTEGEREALLVMLADGEKQADIAERFRVSDRNVAYYANKFRERIQEIAQERSNLALSTGLAMRGNRVERLRALAHSLERKLGGAAFDQAHGRSLPMVREWRETLKQIRDELKDIEPPPAQTVNHAGAVAHEVTVTIVDPKH